MRLHITQPAMTGALKRLRAYFEDDILVQRGRRMFLTPKSEALAEPVRQALLHIRADITRAGNFDPLNTPRHFVVAISDYAFTLLFSRVISKVASLAPKLTFQVIPPGPTVKERFERAELDLVFTYGNTVSVDHNVIELWRDETVIISCKESGFTEISEGVFFESGHAIVNFGADSVQSSTEIYLKNFGRKRKIEAFLPGSHGLCQSLVGTQRLAMMNRLYALNFAKFYPIQLHSPWEAFPTINEGIQWHSVRDNDPGLTWLIDIIKEEAVQLHHRLK